MTIRKVVVALCCAVLVFAPLRWGVALPLSGLNHDGLTVRPFGPAQGQLDRLALRLGATLRVKSALEGIKHRFVSLQMVDVPADHPEPPTRFRAQYYDYGHSQSIYVSGRIAPFGVDRIWRSDDQPVPNSDEYQSAVAIVRQDPLLGQELATGRLAPYRPMPPIVTSPDSSVAGHRTLAVGLLPNAPGGHHEIVGVDMVLGRVIRYPNNAPTSAQATSDTCGPSPSAANAPARGTAGESEVTISSNGTPLWHFFVVRPASSSGTNGSGVELRYVDYRGKRVLGWAHIPIVNVQYLTGECGPYRDWLWEEGDFRAEGVDAAAGHRRCLEAPLTIYDSGDDVGNFQGVSYFTRGADTVLVSEMSAGWYRYVQEWSFSPDGTIRPRFRFGAVADSCTCKLHVHNAYWRFDFDIGTTSHNAVDMFDDPARGGGGWSRVSDETMAFRAPQLNRRWNVTNTVTGSGYSIVPGSRDGTADDFAVGDVWVLNKHADEMDDHRPFTSTAELAKAGITDFVDDEPVNDSDVVVWYGIHVSHQDGDGVSHEGGPDLIPVDW